MSSPIKTRAIPRPLGSHAVPCPPRDVPCPPRAGQTCDNHPQPLGQHNTVTETGSATPAIEPPVLTKIEVSVLSRKCRAAHEAGSDYFAVQSWTLLGVLQELVKLRGLHRKASLSKPNDSQPDPIMPIGGGRYVDLSRVQDIEPKQDQVCLTLVSGAVAWAPVEMAGELIQAWRAIRRAQVWGRAK